MQSIGIEIIESEGLSKRHMDLINRCRKKEFAKDEIKDFSMDDV